MKRIAALLVLGMMLVGCTQYGGTSQSGGNNVAPPGNQSVAGTVTVHMKNFAFGPSDVTVKQGSTVTWVNDDGVPHLVRFPSFESQTLSTGQSYQHTFTEAPGEYAYSCGIHPSMTGKVTVTK